MKKMSGLTYDHSRGCAKAEYGNCTCGLERYELHYATYSHLSSCTFLFDDNCTCGLCLYSDNHINKIIYQNDKDVRCKLDSLNDRVNQVQIDISDIKTRMTEITSLIGDFMNLVRAANQSGVSPK